MPTTSYQISDTVHDRNHTSFKAKQGNLVIETTLEKDTVEDNEKLALWLLAQPDPKKEERPDKDRTLKVKWHWETVKDEETGTDYDIKVLDSVT